MRICIVGGALQGMESVYLARKAGYETFVMDRREDAPAFSLADNHAVIDPIKEPERALRLMSDCDAVLPACENLDLLEKLTTISRDYGGKYLFDLDAYRVSESKAASNDLMTRLGVPLPKPWPESGFPVVVKPSVSSGSIGVTVAKDRESMEKGIRLVESMGGTPVVQEFVSGPGVSMEFIGDGESFRGFATTEIVIGEDYDCKRVNCHPDILIKDDESDLRAMGVAIAEDLRLKGIMDIEALVSNRGLRVLEIDARIPSQTPAAVLSATGINLLEEMVSPSGNKPSRGSSIYEHFVVKDGKMEACGEGEFSKVRFPRYRRGLFGTQEMITDYEPGADEWRFIMITGGKTQQGVEAMRARFLGSIMEQCSIDTYVDGKMKVVL